MKVYETSTLAEIKNRLKPVSFTPQVWTFGSTIEKILTCQQTHSGNYVYRVKMKDGKVIKVSENSLPERYKSLANDMKEQIRLIRNRPKRIRLILRPPKKQKKEKKKKKEKKSRKDQKAKHRKPIVHSPEFSDDGSYVDRAENINEDDDDDDDFNFEYRPSTAMTTHSGRKTTKPQNFLDYYHSNQKKQVKQHQPIEHTFHIPIYTDKSFKEHHSKFCLRCNTQSSMENDVADVSIGYNESRSRLLLCNFCSLSFHNNCVALSSVQVEKEAGTLKCQKCVRSLQCYGCNDSLFDKNKTEITPLRCSTCFRAFHNGCITKSVSSDLTEAIKSYELSSMYEPSRCLECTVYLSKAVESIISERMVNDRLEYFVKWKGSSFRRAEWVAASWISHAYSSAYRSYLKRKEKGRLVPFSKEWLIIDRILDVMWDTQTEGKPSSVLAVFKDRDYAEAVWDEPPSKDETDLYPDYEIALKRYIQATNVRPPENMKSLISQVRSQAMSEKYDKHELKNQPDFITGGQLMKHQMDALNWLIYQWERKQSCILADDMGLGKTIQIATFLYYLFKKFSIYPFFIVVPNSTATNWIREFARWAPDLVVAPYFGSREARKLSLQNEIFNHKGKLKCHVVVGTYESVLENTDLYKLFWPIMVVDESQRLKNDESLLFKNLTKLRVDHTVLLTGTPLQNNLRELFNIMHFIQPKVFEGSQAENYEDLNAAQVDELHGRLRPYFLRRTKEEVLKTLPPKYELIVPVSMTSLQKEVYKQCLSGEIHETLAQATMTKRQKGLSSILANLRKVLNHPYLLDGVEAAQPNLEETHKNMINASAKLKLFHQMLPKLIERGHRMLIFSTMTRTLDVLEDYFLYENIQYGRIDGSTKERERVRQIDAFNAADSKLKVFLLSTRAGGVGINLATADTVIIWDSDFNPYADFQAIGRAHRIGQTKMVLIYRLMTRLSVEEKVLQIAKKRIALEHVIVEKMNDTEEENLEDIESILKHGTEALFSDDGSKDIVYDTAAIDNLLDREQYREVATKQQEKEAKELEDKSSANGAASFAFAKVWQADGSTEELTEEEANDKDTDFWDKFLKEQQVLAEKKKEEKRLAELNLGRGARKRAVVTYSEKLANDIKTSSSGVLPDSELAGKDKDEEYVFSENEEMSESEIMQDEGNPTKKFKPYDYKQPQGSAPHQPIISSGQNQSSVYLTQSHVQGNLQAPQRSIKYKEWAPPQTKHVQMQQLPQQMSNPWPQLNNPQSSQQSHIKLPKQKNQQQLQESQEQALRMQQQFMQQLKKLVQPVKNTQEGSSRMAEDIGKPQVLLPQAVQQNTQVQQQLQQLVQHPHVQNVLQQQQLQRRQQREEQQQRQRQQQQQLQQRLEQQQQQQLYEYELQIRQQEKQRRERELQEMQAAANFYTDILRKSSLRWINEKIIAYKEQFKKNINNNSFKIELFKATRPALVEDIKNYIFECSKRNADNERLEHYRQKVDTRVANEHQSLKIKIATENIGKMSEYIQSELEKLSIELEQMSQRRQQEYNSHLIALQAIVQKQQAEKRALEERQKKELLAASRALAMSTQLNNQTASTIPQRQAITYSAPPPTQYSNQQQLTNWLITQPGPSNSTASSAALQYPQATAPMNAPTQQFINPTMLTLQKHSQQQSQPSTSAATGSSGFSSIQELLPDTKDNSR